MFLQNTMNLESCVENYVLFQLYCFQYMDLNKGRHIISIDKREKWKTFFKNQCLFLDIEFPISLFLTPSTGPPSSEAAYPLKTTSLLQAEYSWDFQKSKATVASKQ